jgi:hypothetical protein
VPGKAAPARIVGDRLCGPGSLSTPPGALPPPAHLGRLQQRIDVGNLQAQAACRPFLPVWSSPLAAPSSPLAAALSARRARRAGRPRLTPRPRSKRSSTKRGPSSAAVCAASPESRRAGHGRGGGAQLSQGKRAAPSPRPTRTGVIRRGRGARSTRCPRPRAARPRAPRASRRRPCARAPRSAHSAPPGCATSAMRPSGGLEAFLRRSAPPRRP